MLHRALLALLTIALGAVAAHAETLLDETGTIVAPTAPSAVLREFEVVSAGSYDLTLTDFAVPQALTAVRAAVLRDGVIVRQIDFGTASTAIATFDATPGTYALSVVGTPGATGIGTIGALVRQGAAPAVLEITETINAANPPPPDTRQSLDTTFAVADTGDYRVSLADLGFPAALAAARLSIVREGGAGLTAQLAAPGVATFTATPGNYRLFVIADAEVTTGAGVYFVAVSSVATDAPLYRRMLPVGHIEELGGGLLSAGEHSLVGTDLGIPAPLNALNLAVTSEGRLVTRLDAPGSVLFTADSAGHEVLSASKAASNTSGSLAAELRGGGGSVLSFVSTPSDGANAGATTLTGVVTTAGPHRLRLTDFAFPQGFSALRATVTQGGVSVATLNTPGTLDVDLAAGAVRVLVFGQANASANGIYGVELRPTTSTSAAVIEATRGVGTAFAAWQFSVTTAGRYQVFADDLEFPQRFAGLDAVITRGPDVVGSFFGGGSFIFSATPGSYFINFIAKPGAQSGGAGTYRMRVATAAALPTVSLTAAPTQVNAGFTTVITWSSTNATQCAATGAWSGNKAASGTETTAALSTQSTFNLDCTGPGGTSAAQLVVNVVAPGSSSGGGGGGGALSETMLLALLAAVALRLFSARARSGRRR